MQGPEAREYSALRDSVARRYGEAVDGLPGVANATLSTLLEHRSVRSFQDVPLPDGTLELLVAAAQSAPTSSNIQAYSIVAVQDAARRARLAVLAGNQRHIAAAPLFLLFVADLARIEAVGDHRGAELKGLDFTESFLLAAIDAVLAAQNAAVAAEAIGLGTVYIGGVRNKPLEIAAEVDLPPRCFAVTGLVVGVPDPEVQSEVKPRLPQSAILHHETYRRDSQIDDVSRHDGHLLAFRQRQQLSPDTWSDLVCRRLGTVEGLHGRDKLRQALETLGFALR